MPIINNTFKEKVITECSKLPYVFTPETQQLAVLLIAGLSSSSYISISANAETLWGLGEESFQTEMALYLQSITHPIFLLVNNYSSILANS